MRHAGSSGGSARTPLRKVRHHYVQWNVDYVAVDKAKGPQHFVPISELLAIRNENKSNFGVKFIKQLDGTFLDPRKLHRMRRGGNDDEAGEDVDDEEWEGRRRTRGIPVEQLDIDSGKVLRRYASQIEAAAAMGVNPVQISLCCRGKLSDAHGFMWRSSECKVRDIFPLE